MDSRGTEEPRSEKRRAEERLFEVDRTDELLAAYRRADCGEDAGVKAIFARDYKLDPDSYEIVSLPSLRFDFEPAEGEHGIRPPPREAVESRLIKLVFGLAFRNRGLADFARNTPREAQGVAARISTLDNWCPSESSPPFFDTRRRANALIDAASLGRQAPPLTGEAVNVLVVDEGFSARRLRENFPGFAYSGGWVVEEPGRPKRRPGRAAPNSHGTMTSRNVLSLAPGVRLFDLPLLPDRITDVTLFIGWASAAMWWVVAEIELWRELKILEGRWVFSNAWGIYDTRLESEKGGYTDNPDHPFNRLVARVDGLGHDQVFAAGNCGQFCANGRCGPTDRGVGRSILGANSSPHVLTVGAVRADGLWLGYSSQGPGQPSFAPVPGALVEKPDLCAPSHFVEPDDAATLNSGTSAACGLAAGAIAALRQAPALGGSSPDALRTLLRDRARRPPGPDWNLRLGYGILDLGRVLGPVPAPVVGPAVEQLVEPVVAMANPPPSPAAPSAPLSRLARFVLNLWRRPSARAHG